MGVRVSEHGAPGPNGPVRVRVYRRDGEHELRGIGLVWAHGGGFAAGSLDMPEADGVARRIAEDGVTVVSADYRLVDDSVHYPVPSDDVLAAVDWTRGNADRLGIRADRLVVGGASAGANLATGVTLRLARAGRSDIAGLFLAYPTLHAVQPTTPLELARLLQRLPDPGHFGPASVRSMYEDYVGGAVETADSVAVPALATRDELSALPPVLIVNDEIDELRVSGEAFARAFEAAGVPVERHTEPDVAHGHLNRPEEAGHIEATIAMLTSWLRRTLR